MMTKDFHQRLTAQEALQHWHHVKSKLKSSIGRLRLRKLNASIGDTVLNTVVGGVVSLTCSFDERQGNLMYGLKILYDNWFHRTLDRATGQDHEYSNEGLLKMPKGGWTQW